MNCRTMRQFEPNLEPLTFQLNHFPSTFPHFILKLFLFSSFLNCSNKCPKIFERLRRINREREGEREREREKKENKNAQ